MVSIMFLRPPVLLLRPAWSSKHKSSGATPEELAVMNVLDQGTALPILQPITSHLCHEQGVGPHGASLLVACCTAAFPVGVTGGSCFPGQDCFNLHNEQRKTRWWQAGFLEALQRSSPTWRPPYLREAKSSQSSIRLRCTHCSHTSWQWDPTQVLLCPVPCSLSLMSKHAVSHTDGLTCIQPESTTTGLGFHQQSSCCVVLAFMQLASASITCSLFQLHPLQILHPSCECHLANCKKSGDSEQGCACSKSGAWHAGAPAVDTWQAALTPWLSCICMNWYRPYCSMLMLSGSGGEPCYADCPGKCGYRRASTTGVEPACSHKHGMSMPREHPSDRMCEAGVALLMADGNQLPPVCGIPMKVPVEVPTPPADPMQLISTAPAPSEQPDDRGATYIVASGGSLWQLNHK